MSKNEETRNERRKHFTPTTMDKIPEILFIQSRISHKR